MDIVAVGGGSAGEPGEGDEPLPSRAAPCRTGSPLTVTDNGGS
jgi:hypothetical protein